MEKNKRGGIKLGFFLLCGMVQPLRSHPNATPKCDVGATLAVARLRGLPVLPNLQFGRKEHKHLKCKPNNNRITNSVGRGEGKVELLRSSVVCGASYPELRFAHSGLSISNSFGVSARMTSLLVVWTKGVRFLTTFGMTSTSVLWTNGAAATPPLLSPPHRRPVIAGLTRNPLKNKGIPAFAGMTAL